MYLKWKVRYSSCSSFLPLLLFNPRRFSFNFQALWSATPFVVMVPDWKIKMQMRQHKSNQLNVTFLLFLFLVWSLKILNHMEESLQIKPIRKGGREAVSWERKKEKKREREKESMVKTSRVVRTTYLALNILHIHALICDIAFGRVTQNYFAETYTTF